MHDLEAPKPQAPSWERSEVPSLLMLEGMLKQGQIPSGFLTEVREALEEVEEVTRYGGPIYQSTLKLLDDLYTKIESSQHSQK